MLIFFGLLVIGWIAGIAAALTAAFFTSIPMLFLSTGALAYGIFCYVGILIIRRHNKRTKRWAIAIGAILFGVTAFAILKPPDDPQNEPEPIEGLQYWALPTGSKIAYSFIEGKGPRQSYPVLFLHGGPGTPDMAGDLRYFGKLSEDGYDVYVYDQLGSGRSSRLQDPRGYVLSRDAADLEAIRRQIGAEKMILVGHSYGCNIAAQYMASYGQHVAKAVLVSPGPINPSDRSDAQLTGRLDASRLRDLYALLLQPRTLFAYALLQIDPRASYAFAGDKEMDARFDLVYAATEPALHAKGKRYAHPIYGLGFYAHQTPQSRTASMKPDLRPLLANVQAPILVLKAAEDYLSWSSAIDYRKALKESRLIYIEEAGHNAYQDQPDLVKETIRAFLAERELPLPPDASMSAPASFQGAH